MKKKKTTTYAKVRVDLKIVTNIEKGTLTRPTPYQAPTKRTYTNAPIFRNVQRLSPSSQVHLKDLLQLGRKQAEQNQRQTLTPMASRARTNSQCARPSAWVSTLASAWASRGPLGVGWYSTAARSKSPSADTDSRLRF